MVSCVAFFFYFCCVIWIVEKKKVSNGFITAKYLCVYICVYKDIILIIKKNKTLS